ncbi:diguanylate cyclase [Vibrio sp. 10N.286.49.B3]|uniref:sensor domain-containing diguanylate cyclase n=1 Tax=Vibrio sp. 10N.286.49.B3 TaxID=1880855 RepID=UPI000C83C1FE|nr:diguanylate cyclase [Vibrio sp. 10N.286.49.B3]PMH44932.1 diguanylate cyclase [Vibrio sp. 10N.286.49.B3]
MNTKLTIDIDDLHWMMQLLDTMDSGLVVLDRDYNVCIWNSFMQSYSGILAQDIIGRNLFTVCTDIPKSWLEHKMNAAAKLEGKSFSSWEDRPYLFKFSNFSPVSQGLDYMYQDIVITPLRSLSSGITHIALMINDVSDIAKSKIELSSSNQHLEKISQTDGLTDLYNRIHWERCLSAEFKHLLSDLSRSSSLVMIDIDHFKKINDTYGHSIGDEVIKIVSSTIKSNVRSQDLCGRYGGEEFIILLPNTTGDEAFYFAERLRKKIASLALKVATHQVQVTISLGVSCCEANHYFANYHDWLKEVDNHLYQSKHTGRNCTTHLAANNFTVEEIAL